MLKVCKYGGIAFVWKVPPLIRISAGGVEVWTPGLPPLCSKPLVPPDVVQALKYNKSCARAWEYMGAVMEREQSYKDAAEHYEQAWKHENQASAAVSVMSKNMLPPTCRRRRRRRRGVRRAYPGLTDHCRQAGR